MTTSVATTKLLKTLLSQLVAMPTLPGDFGACQEAIDWVKSRLGELPLHVTDYAHDGHPAVIFTTRQTKRPKVLLLAHLDVMAPSGAAGFELRERDGKYFGRGVFDMKFAAASYIKLLLELGGSLPEYDLGVMFTTDEEPADNHNTAAQLARQGWGAEVIINPDAIGNWNIEEAAKGSLRYQVDSRGESGHGSRPWLYRNALRQLITYLLELEKQFEVAEPCGDEDHRHHTFSVNTMQGGLAHNQIPGEAQARIELRLMPGETVAATDAIIRKLAAGHDGITLTQLSACDAIALDSNHPYAQLLSGLIKGITGQKPEFTLSHGASDSPHFVHAGMLVLMTGPTGGGHHSGEEWVDATSMEQFYEVIRQFVSEVAHLV